MAFPKIEGYVVTEKLGSGSYSTVYKAFTKVGGRAVVAVKCVEKARMRGAAADNLVTEIRLLKTLSHPHIVSMREFSWDDRNIYIIMEYCCGGDLSKYIRRYGRVPEKQVLYFLQQLASALKFLREKGVAHMDLKPHNLLLQRGADGKYALKVADFGFAQFLSDESRQRMVRGSPLYMAPEMLQGHYTASVDLWSVGVIMYECLFGSAPYSSGTLKELVDKIQNRAPIMIPAGASVSNGCRDLLTRLLRHDPEERITYEEFFAHPYLDLEHMPSKENYDKAVALIKQAVSLDGAGRGEEAFAAYCASLRYLVPAVHCEADAMRRQALRAKLNSYMERAEQLKAQLRGTPLPPRAAAPSPSPSPCPSPSPAAAPSPRAAPAPRARPPPRAGCCGATEQSTSLDLDARRAAVAACSACAACTHTHTPGTRAPECTCTLNKRIPSEDSERTTDKPSVRARLLRLFGRQTLPYLDTGDPTEEPGRPEKLPPPGETAGDGCRIT